MNIISKKWRSRKTVRDLVIACFSVILIFIIASFLNFSEKIQVFSQNHERWQIDELFTLIIALFFAFIIFSIFRWRELSHEIIEHHRAKEQIKLNEARLQSLYSISQHKSNELGVFLDHVLNEAIHLTGSKIGWFGFYEEQNKTLTVSNWSKEVMKDCEIPEKKMVFPVENPGIWAEGIRLRTPFIVNDYQAFSLGKRGFPEGHSKVFKFLTIPLLLEGRIIAVMAVANKEQDYDETDILQLTLLMDSVLKMIEQKRAERALHKREEEAKRLVQEDAVVAEIGRIISSTLNIEDVYERFVEKVREIIHFDRIAISNISSRDDTITPAYVAGLDVMDRPKGKAIPLTGTFSEKVVQTRKSMLIHGEDLKKTADKFPQFIPIFQVGIRSLIIIPLISNDEVIGILQIQSTNSNAYSLRDLGLAEKVGHQIAGAIANAQLFAEQKQVEKALQKSEKEAKRLAQENAIMAEIGRIITSTLNIEEVYERFSEEVLKLIPFDRIAINLYNPKDNTITITYITGVDVLNRGSGDTIPFTGTAAGECIRTRSSLLLQADQIEKVVSQFPMLLPTFQSGVQSLIFVPLISKDQVIGALFLRASKINKYTEEDLRLAERVANQVAGAIANAQLFTEQKRAEEALRRSEERLKELYDNAPIGYHEFDTKGCITRVNKTEVEMLGYTEEEMLGRHAWDFITETVWIEALKKRLTGELPVGQVFERTFRRKDGTTFPALIHERFIRDDKGEIKGIRSTIQDITELKQAEERMNTLQEQLRQSQKMEAIGRLAGGIAHDFNNLLTVIKGYSQLSFFELKEGDPLRGNIDEIQKASQRASDLTRQLLAFSRRQILEFMVFDLNTILRDLDKMLHRIIGEDIELVYLLSDRLGKIKTDPGQIEQVILNLAVNARDAMPSGGKLTIETANVFLDESYTQSHADVKPGPYVMLSVTDTGCGMAKEVEEHIFEPFFTIKEKGMGTGLGLSTVYGIVKQSGGDIWVYSEVGQGTTFKIYLPREEEEPLEEVREKVVKEELLRGSETLLVVEDDEELRKLAVRFLQKQGYKVLEASQGDEALSIYGRHDEPIHLLLTDVVMPGMSGRELSERLTSLRPEIKILYMSGYTNGAIVHQGVLEQGVNLLLKPFTPEALARKVHEVLKKQENQCTCNTALI
jgi:two-component system cell cycle sensor histidine kinase/response regulator CckA